MTEPLHRFEVITAQHDVSRFNSHDAYLDYVLREKALDYTVRDLARTYVLLEHDEVIGYLTLQADSIAGEQISMPLVHVLFLARNYSHRGRGLGDVLLLEALRQTVIASEVIGVAGIYLAYTAEGKRLYDKYGFGEHPYPYHLLLPINVIRTILQDIDTLP